MFVEVPLLEPQRMVGFRELHRPPVRSRAALE